MTRPISHLDVPAPKLVDDLRALVARQRAQRLAAGVAAEARHLMDDDAPWSRLACDHPEHCSCDADYPGWTPGAIA
ncbi:hypothetical protein ABZV65_19845 [Streptomyces bauhiniae]|uniref:hypothetical protein n=1 Tax=Streptomyces bauhiniae TaxID=2340725 RepID=UPI0033B6F810